MSQRAGLGTDNPQSTASLNENVSGTESQTSSPSPPPTARQPIVLPSSQDNLSTRDKPLDVVDISQSSPSPSTTRQSFIVLYFHLHKITYQPVIAFFKIMTALILRSLWMLSIFLKQNQEDVVERVTRIVLRRIDVLVNFLTLLPGNQSVVSVIKLGIHRAVILRTYHLFLDSKIGNALGAMSHSLVTHLSPKPCLMC